MSDLSRYGEWNPFTPEVTGQLAVGQRVWLRVRIGPLIVPMPETIETLEPERELVWGTRWPLGLLTGRRVQRLEPHALGCTYITEERFTGLLAPLVYLVAGGLVRRGFQATASALARAAEHKLLEDAR